MGGRQAPLARRMMEPPGGGWWAGRDSNPRPRRPVEALPLELRSPWWVAPGLEPGTFHIACALPLSYQPMWEPSVGLPCLLPVATRVSGGASACRYPALNPRGRSRGTASGGWWAVRGSNPRACHFGPSWRGQVAHARAFPVVPSLRAFWSWAGLEPASHPCSRAALPTELPDHGHRTFGNAVRGGPRSAGRLLAERAGLEPAAGGFGVRCSSN